MTEQIKDLFTKRWRKVRPPNPKEHQIQISLVARLKLQCRPGVIYFHTANGELRDDATGAKLKAMGVKPGVADLIFIWSEEHAGDFLIERSTGQAVPYRHVRVLNLELKRRRGTQSPEQRAYQQQVLGLGSIHATYELADNIDDAVAILEYYGILPGGKQRGRHNGATAT